MGLARSCALTAVSVWLAALLQRKENTVRQQLREWCYEAEAKWGAHRQALAVEACFVSVLQWILSTWQGHTVGSGPRCHYVGDPSHRARHQCGLSRLCHSRGLDNSAHPCAACLAPRVAADVASVAAGHASWVDRDHAGRSGLVCPLAVSADRALGLAPVVAHQYRRHLSPRSSGTSRPWASLVPHLGTRWQGTGTAFKNPQRQLRCTC
jgi:hypothetical protein